MCSMQPASITERHGVSTVSMRTFHTRMRCQSQHAASHTHDSLQQLPSLSYSTEYGQRSDFSPSHCRRAPTMTATAVDNERAGRLNRHARLHIPHSLQGHTGAASAPRPLLLLPYCPTSPSWLPCPLCPPPCPAARAARWAACRAGRRRGSLLRLPPGSAPAPAAVRAPASGCRSGTAACVGAANSGGSGRLRSSYNATIVSRRTAKAANGSARSGTHRDRAGCHCA